MRLTRRELLAAGTTGGATALAGCTGGCSGLIPSLGAEMPHDGVITVEPASSVPDDATVVAFSELSDAEQSLLRTAREDGVVRVCATEGGEQTDALRSFADRVTVDDSYVAFGDDHYALYVRVTDIVATDTAPRPADDGGPCC